MKKTIFSLSLFLAAAGISAAPPEEEQYGARIYFSADNFERGNYRDYFQTAFFGSLIRNCEGKTGTFAKVTYGESRPFKIIPGKRYRLSFDAFNLGAKDLSRYNPSGAKTPFPQRFAFLDDFWKTVGEIKGKDIPGSETQSPPPAKWTAYSFEFECPRKAEMFTFSISSAWKNNWGPYLLSNVRLSEIKEEK